MDKETKLELLRHAVRWAANILVEVQGNYGEALSPGKRVQLHNAIQALSDFQYAWTAFTEDDGSRTVK